MTQILVTSHRQNLLRLLAGQEVLEDHHADLNCQRIGIKAREDESLTGQELKRKSIEAE